MTPYYIPTTFTQAFHGAIETFPIRRKHHVLGASQQSTDTPNIYKKWRNTSPISLARQHDTPQGVSALKSSSRMEPPCFQTLHTASTEDYKRLNSLDASLVAVPRWTPYSHRNQHAHRNRHAHRRTAHDATIVEKRTATASTETESEGRTKPDQETPEDRSAVQDGQDWTWIKGSNSQVLFSSAGSTSRPTDCPICPHQDHKQDLVEMCRLMPDFFRHKRKHNSHNQIYTHKN